VTIAIITLTDRIRPPSVAVEDDPAPLHDRPDEIRAGPVRDLIC
jgi:hypothetical protein